VSTSAPGGSQHRSHILRGYLFIAGATFFWGASATLGKAAFRGIVGSSGGSVTEIDPLILSQTRTTFAFLLLLPTLLLLEDRSSLRLSRKDFFYCVLLGTLGLAGSNFFYYFAIEKTTVATAIILQYTAPVWVLLYMVARRLQRASFERVLGVALAVIGSALAIGVITVTLGAPFLLVQGLRFDTLGVIAALLAALSFAFYNVLAQGLVSRNPRWTIFLYALLATSVFWIFVNPPWKIMAAHYSGAQWLFLFIFSIFSMLIPYALYFTGLQHLDPTRAIVTSCLEPIFAIAFAALFLQEGIGWPQAIGMLVVLAATIIVQLPERGKKLTREPVGPG